MLVLSRQRDEKIILEIPPSSQKTIIEVCVVDIRRDKVRLGVKAPVECPVHREEVYKAIQREVEERRLRKEGGGA